jgi:hypothetical protein
MEPVLATCASDPGHNHYRLGDGVAHAVPQAELEWGLEWFDPALPLRGGTPVLNPLRLCDDLGKPLALDIHRESFHGPSAKLAFPL